METYQVHFWIRDKDNGYLQQKIVRYPAHGKAGHKLAERQWRKEFPDGILISIEFE